MEQPADDIFSSKLDRSREGEQGYRIKGKKGRGSTICRENRPVVGTGHGSRHRNRRFALARHVVVLVVIVVLRESRIFRIPSGRLARRSHHALVRYALAYTYNNVTHTPRLRLFLLFRPVAARVLTRVTGVVGSLPCERNVSDRSDKWDESQEPGARAR